MRIVWLSILVLLAPMIAEAQSRRAFVVGVQNYDELTDLTKTISDAEGYTAVFDDLGFEVTKLTNPSYFEFVDAISDFTESVSEGDEIAFVFSGHGWSDGARNYLVMRDAPLKSTEAALKRRTFDLSSQVLDDLRRRKPRLVLAVIDACRDNPFELGTKTVTKGLVPQQTIPGSMVVYAAGANQQALDRLQPDDPSPYSVFTRTLLPKLSDDTKPIARAFDEARDETAALANQIEHAQRPAIYSDISLDYCFAEACENLEEDLQAAGQTMKTVFESALEKLAVDAIEDAEGDYSSAMLLALHTFNTIGSEQSRRLLLQAHIENQLIRVFGDGGDDLRAAAFSRNGSRIATVSRDGNLRLWSAETESVLWTAEIPESSIQPGLSSFTTMAISDDGTRLAMGTDTGAVLFWDAMTGEITQVFEDNELPFSLDNNIISISLSTDGRVVAAGSGAGIVQVWDTQTNTLLSSLKADEDWIDPSKTGTVTSVTTGIDGTVEAYYSGPPKNITAVAVSPEGSQVVMSPSGGPALLWNAISGDLLGAFDGHTRSLHSISFSGDGLRLVTGSYDGKALVWNVESGALIQTFEQKGYSVSAVDISGDGAHVATGFEDGTTMVWETDTGTSLQRFKGHKGTIKEVFLSSDGAHLLTDAWDSTARLWRMQPGAKSRLFGGTRSPIQSVALSEDGLHLVTGSLDARARLWDTAKSTILQTFEGHEQAITSVAISKDGSRLATASMDGTARYIDTKTGIVLHDFQVAETGVSSVAISSDGTFIATGSVDGTARLWSTATGRLLNVFDGHLAPVRSVALSPDDSMLATVSFDQTLRLWDLETKKLLHVLNHGEWIGSVAFSGDGKRVVTGGGVTASIWSSETGELIRDFRESGSDVRSLDISEDGMWLITGSFDGSVRYWNTSTGRLNYVFRGHELHVHAAVLHPDQSLMATAAGDGTARLWEIPSILLKQHDEQMLAVCDRLTDANIPIVLDADFILDNAILWIDGARPTRLALDPSIPADSLDFPSPCSIAD